MTQRLVYTGSVTVSFMGINAEVNPGEEFNVPDELAEGFLQRPDIEVAPEHPTVETDEPQPVAEPAPKPKKAAQSEPAAS